MSGAIVVAVVMAGYAIGTFPTAVLVGRRFGFDPTAAGSGNPGTSNSMRVGGRKAGLIVLAGDLGKGAVAAGIGLGVDGSMLAWVTGAAAVAGHMWPVTRGFRGGKGVATGAGVGAVCLPVAMVVPCILFGVLIAISHRAAVGSIAAVASMPVMMALIDRPGAEIVVASLVAMAIIGRHRSNLVEIRQDGFIRARG